jgi:hypothetical protein
MATKAKGTILEYHSGVDLTVTTSFTAIARIKSIKPPKRSAKGIDITVLESDQTERVPGLPEVGESEIKIEYDKTKAGVLDALFNVQQVYRIHYPDGSGRKFIGWISEDGEDEVANGEVIHQTVKLTVTGDVVFIPAIT